MLHDVLGSLVAVLAFAVVLYAPGYVVAYAADLFGFRQMGFADRSLWAIACSFCVAPITAYLVGRSAGLSGICWLFGLSAIGTLLLLALRSSKTGLVSPRPLGDRSAGMWMDRLCAADAGRPAVRQQAVLQRGHGRPELSHCIYGRRGPDRHSPGESLVFRRRSGADALLLLLVCAVCGGRQARARLGAAVLHCEQHLGRLRPAGDGESLYAPLLPLGAPPAMDRARAPVRHRRGPHPRSRQRNPATHFERRH